MFQSPRTKTKSNAGTQRQQHAARRNPMAACLVLCLLAAPAALLATPAAFAQQRPPMERIVQGDVTNDAGAPISGAVVYLKDSKSLAMKTYLTDTAGHYRFGELSQNTDYEIWAESHGEKSKSKSISSFDNRNNFQYSFKINMKK
jgi:hypothetical protein